MMNLIMNLIYVFAPHDIKLDYISIYLEIYLAPLQPLHTNLNGLL